MIVKQRIDELDEPVGTRYTVRWMLTKKGELQRVMQLQNSVYWRLCEKHRFTTQVWFTDISGRVRRWVKE